MATTALARSTRMLVCAAPIAIAAALAPAAAHAAITITPGADTVSTSRLELDFGNAAANVETLDGVRWRDSGGVLSSNLVANSGPGCGADPADGWGGANSVNGMPGPVGDGTTGSWTPRGLRSVEIASSRPTACSGDTVVTPVRTRYTFFDSGGSANKVRVERTISFSAGTPAYAAPSMRAYIPRLPLASFTQVVHPNSAGTALVTDQSFDPPQFETNWNQTWLALNNPATNAGVVILRESSNPARLVLDNNGIANSSSVDLLQPGGGWKTAVTETEWLCFYDAVSWPLAQRTAANLPSQCSVVPVPINTAGPSIAGVPKVGTELTASAGTWDGAATQTFQWLRCAGGACTAIAGATNLNYTPGDADEGKQLRIDVTATATGGEADTASSPLTDGVKSGPPQSTGAPLVSGEARQDEVLTGTAGNWSGSPGSFQYQWLRCATAAGTSCTDVPGATQSSYKLVRDDVGATMRLRVRAVNGLGTSLPADSTATGVVDRLVVRATLVTSPNLSCTGIDTTFDASGSKTPNPPFARYRMTYQNVPIGVFFAAAIGGQAVLDEFIARSPTYTLYDGNNPRPVVNFTWNRQLDRDELSGRKGDYVRDPILVRVTVTDLAGASASASELVGFSQGYSSGSRDGCPKKLNVKAYAFATVSRAATKVTAKAVSAVIPCATRIACAGSLKVVKATTSVRRAAKAKPVVLAANPLFTVAGKKRATVRAPLTKAGRALVRRGKPIRATLQLTSINPATGKRTTRSTTITWPGKKKRR